MNRSNGAVWVLAELHLKLLHLKLLHLKSPSNLLCHDNRSMTEP
jgi:hypothetical protein